MAALIAGQTASDATVRDTYDYLKRKFIANGRTYRAGEHVRANIVDRFESIDRHVPMATTATDGLFLAELLLDTDAPGMVVEAGCYARREFSEALDHCQAHRPEARRVRQLRRASCQRGILPERSTLPPQRRVGSDWTAGRYAATLDAVRGNVERFGEISVCRFEKGWLSDTLVQANLQEHIAFSFVDVDVASSARDCFVALWPRLSEKGVYVTHDTAYIKVLQELYDPGLWRDTFRAVPPILFGAGYGLCNDSPHIGYMVKGESLSPDYLKRLTIDK